MKKSLIIVLISVLYACCTYLGAMEVGAAGAGDAKAVHRDSVSTISLPAESAQPRSAFQQACHDGDIAAIKTSLTALLRTEKSRFAGIEIRFAFNETDLKEAIEIILENKEAAQHITDQHLTKKATEALVENNSPLFTYLLTKVSTDGLKSLLEYIREKKAGQWGKLVEQEQKRRDTSKCIVM